MKRWIRAAVGLAFVAMPLVASADEEGSALVKKMFDALPSKPFKAKVKMTSDRGWTRELTMIRQNTDGVDKIYLEVTAPSDLKDTRFLLIDRVVGKDEQQMFVPQMKRVVLLNNETRKQEFLGSDFLVTDLVRPDLDAFTYTITGKETVGSKPCTVVEAVPKNPADEAYSKFQLCIDPDDVLAVRVVYFDPAGKPLKTMTLDKVERIDGELTPVIQRMVTQSGHSSQMELLEMKYGAELPGDVFSKTYLTR